MRIALQRIAKMAAITLPFAVLASLAPADPPGGGEVYLAVLLVLYGAALIGVERGLLD
jgi:hypothetical protein